MKIINRLCSVTRFVLIMLAIAGCGSVGGRACVDIGCEYLGATYTADPLGEAMPPDVDPLIRTDAFDCTTFVETALAGGNLKKLNKIRYKNGDVDFLNRNHFIETDWLINNAGLVENVSSEYGPTARRDVAIDKQNWMRVVHSINTDFAPLAVVLEYIPYEYVKNIRVAKPMIVLFISGKSEKNDKIGTDIAVRHMGFLLPNGMLRHASSQAGCVVDVDFDEYVQMRSADKNNIGIMLVEIK